MFRRANGPRATSDGQAKETAPPRRQERVKRGDAHLPHRCIISTCRNTRGASRPPIPFRGESETAPPSPSRLFWPCRGVVATQGKRQRLVRSKTVICYCWSWSYCKRAVLEACKGVGRFKLPSAAHGVGTAALLCSPEQNVWSVESMPLRGRGDAHAHLIIDARRVRA